MAPYPIAEKGRNIKEGIRSVPAIVRNIKAGSVTLMIIFEMLLLSSSFKNRILLRK
jgi:hypothetical protein